MMDGWRGLMEIAWVDEQGLTPVLNALSMVQKVLLMTENCSHTLEIKEQFPSWYVIPISGCLS